MELQDTLNEASINPIEDIKAPLGGQSGNNNNSLKVINAQTTESIQESLYLPTSTNNRQAQVDYGEVSGGTETPNLDDKLTLTNADNRESPMVRYIDGPPIIGGSNNSTRDLRITNMTYAQSNLAANMTSTSINTTMRGNLRQNPT